MLLIRGRKYVFVGAGASGKDYAKRIALENGFKSDVSFTTRPPRDNEVDDKDYKFVSKDEFKRMIETGELVQWNLFGNGHYYGTSINSWEQNEIFIVDPITIKKLGKKFFNDRIVVFFNIGREIRKNRLEKRGDKNDSVERRLSTDDIDFIKFNIWDIEITEPDFEIGVTD